MSEERAKNTTFCAVVGTLSVIAMYAAVYVVATFFEARDRLSYPDTHGPTECYYDRFDAEKESIVSGGKICAKQGFKYFDTSTYAAYRCLTPDFVGWALTYEVRCYEQPNR